MRFTIKPSWTDDVLGANNAPMTHPCRSWRNDGKFDHAGTALARTPRVQYTQMLLAHWLCPCWFFDGHCTPRFFEATPIFPNGALHNVQPQSGKAFWHSTLNAYTLFRGVLCKKQKQQNARRTEIKQEFLCNAVTSSALAQQRSCHQI